MAEEKNGRKIRPILDMIRETFPSDENLQEAKKSRGETAGKVTDYLSGKGFPTAGAIAGTAVDLTKDLIPNTQEEYMESLATSGGGGAGTVGKKAAKEAVKEGETLISKLLARGPKLSKVSGASSPLTGAGPDLTHALINDPVLFESMVGKSTAEARDLIAKAAKEGRTVSGPTATAGTTKVKPANMEAFEYMAPAKKSKGASFEVDYSQMNPKKAVPKPSDYVYDAKQGGMRKRLPGETD